MNEAFFLVGEAVEGGYIARVIGGSVFTEGENINDLKDHIKKAVVCHFGTICRVSLSLSKA